MRSALRTVVTCMVALLMLFPWQGFTQNDAQAPTFSKEQIEQLVAPIALYPDDLLSQVLMASTYPLEVVSAARWLKANPKLKGKDLENALQKQPWDPSIKSLVAVPQVLNMLNEKLDMTERLGNAFLAQQQDVMDAIQRLRVKAQNAGNLKTTKQQVVTTKHETNNTIIEIAPASPDIVYVPAYNPTVIYGEWPYPDYPPYEYYPAGYVPGTLFAFGSAVLVGQALWGAFDWHTHDVNIDVNRYNSFNRTHIDNNRWQHNVNHRHGVAYPNKATREKFGKGQLDNAKAREQFRGTANKGRQQLERGNMNQVKRDLNRGNQNLKQRKSAQGPKQRTSHRPHQAKSHAQPRVSHQQRRPSQAHRSSSARAYHGNRGGQMRSYSHRAAPSRSFSRGGFSRPHSGGMRAGGMRGGGGMHRGGGGRRR